MALHTQAVRKTAKEIEKIISIETFCEKYED